MRNKKSSSSKNSEGKREKIKKLRHTRNRDLVKSAGLHVKDIAVDVASGASSVVIVTRDIIRERKCFFNGLEDENMSKRENEDL